MLFGVLHHDSESHYIPSRWRYIIQGKSENTMAVVQLIQQSSHPRHVMLGKWSDGVILKYFQAWNRPDDRIAGGSYRIAPTLPIRK